MPKHMWRHPPLTKAWAIYTLYCEKRNITFLSKLVWGLHYRAVVWTGLLEPVERKTGEDRSSGISEGLRFAL